MSALPGRDRLADDEAREEARSTEHDGPVSTTDNGHDLLAELQEAVKRDPRYREPSR